MNFFKRTLKDIIRRWKLSTRDLPEFKEDIKIPISYRIRRFLRPNIIIPSYLISTNGAYHPLSNDPVDDNVIEELLGRSSNLFFPELSNEIKSELENGGYILDVGAYNGSWGIEMLKLYTNARAIFLEPSPAKCRNINKAIIKNKFPSKAQLISSGIGAHNGKAWLVMSEHGSWGDWLEYEKPEPPIRSLDVSTIRLQDVLNGIVPVIIKCNAEGGEFELVRQLLEYKIRPKYLIIMVHIELGDVKQLYANLSDIGYSINVVKDHPRRPVLHAKL